MVVANNKIDDNKKCRQINNDFDGHGNASKLLYAAIGQVPASYRPGGCHG
jgi:hypothetical protein